MNARPSRSIAAVALCTFVIVLLQGAPVSALPAHPYKCQITASATPSASECNGFGNTVPGGAFANPHGLALDGAGNLYVSDGVRDAVDVFDSTGNFTRQITGTSPTSPFSNPWGLAIDGSGDAWVSDVGPGLIDKFDTAGGLLAQGDGQGHWSGVYTDSVAFSDASNHLYVADSNHDDLWVLNADGTYNTDITGPWGSGCCFIDAAADNSGGSTAGDIYVSSRETLYRIDGAGAPAPFSGSAAYISGAQLTGTPNGSFGSLGGVTVDPNGDVYVLDNGRGVVDEFDSAGVFVAQATGNGTPGGSFGGLQAVAADAAGNVYVASGSVVDVFGPATTLPTATVEPATEVRESTATIGGTVDPENAGAVTCEFQWGTSTAYEHVAACPAGIPNGGNPVPVQVHLSGLEANTTYHYRLLATDANGTEGSSDESFTTPGPPTFRAESAEVAAHEKSGQTSATLQAEIDPQGSETTYSFEYGETASYGARMPATPASLGSGMEWVSVPAAELSGLKLATTYHYRVVASNEYGTVDGPDQTFTTLPGLLLDGESVSRVTATSATIEAEINPLGSDTKYHLEYGPTAAYGTKAPVPDGDVGAGEADVTVSLHVQGLQASTGYHFRVVAENALGAVTGPDKEFLTQTVGGGEYALADNRAWEMVSPPEKSGANLSPISEQDGLEQAASAGNAFTYASNTPVEPEPQSLAGKVQELSVRGPHGWAPVTITVPHIAVSTQPIGYGPEYRFFSADLSQAAIQPIGLFNPGLSPEASEQTAFIHSLFSAGNVGEPCASSCYHPLATGKPGYANVPPGTIFGGSGGGERFLGRCHVGCGPNFVGATPDMSHVVLSTSEAGLTPGAGSHGGLYEWSAGELTFIGNGTVGRPGADAISHSISDDGTRIVLDGEAEGHSGLLMRDMATGETVKLDAVQGGSGAGEPEPLFQAASSDGSRVFFVDRRRLTSDSGASSEGARDLYECEMVVEGGALTCRLSDLTPEMNGEHASVQGALLGVSEDGSWVYFMANGKLGTQAKEGACGSYEGQCNLYVRHFNGSEWEPPKFITTLSEERDGNDWRENPSTQSVRVSPNGEWLTFMSQAPLTGYDNREVGTGRPDAEVYIYDAAGGRLTCASCDPTGARPVGREYHQLEPGSGGLVGGPRGVWDSNDFVAANLPGWQHTNISNAVEPYQSRYLSNDGRLFFNSDDALVPQDVNGTEDVYEYEPPGIGTCTTASVTFSARSGGCVTLISSGSSPQESGFLDASENGSDVFFITSEQLAPQDFDTSLDIYDAHECSAQVPCATPPSSPPPCTTGDACKPAPTPQPAIYGSPSSATFSGAGNVTPAGAGAVAPKSLTRSQKLQRALRACREKRRARRAGCERTARRRYGAAPRKARGKTGSKATKRKKG